MEFIEERIDLISLIEKLQYFMNRKSIILTPDYIKSMMKIDILMIASFIKVNPIKIVTKKKSYFSHIGSSTIINIYPIESIYVLLYTYTILFDTSNKNITRDMELLSSLIKKDITVYIFDEKYDETLKQSHMLSLLTSIRVFGDGLKMNIGKIDELYNIGLNKVSGTKKSPTGTFLQSQSTKYFKSKYNPNSNMSIPIEELKTKRKNYLKASNDEIIVVQCPICKNKHKRLFNNIKSLFSISKSTVTLACSHTNTIHKYQSKPYSFKIDIELTKNHTKLEVVMYIINNKGYYGLSPNQKTS